MSEKAAISKMAKLSKEGMEDTMKEQSLDAVAYPNKAAEHAMAIGGLPIISVPAGYSTSGAPSGISFAGLKGTDAKLIEIAYAFEQATRSNKLNQVHESNTIHYMVEMKMLMALPQDREQRTFDFEEATIADIQAAFAAGRLTSSQLVSYYLRRISSLNPRLRAVIEVNPDALSEAARTDSQRAAGTAVPSPLHGIPVLVKDNIATRDKLNTTSGSLALLGSVVPRDAGVVDRLRRAGAIIIGKASMSEWDNFRSLNVPLGWNPRSGEGQNPYPGADGPCGTSSGSAIAVAANMATVSLATDLDGAISCPASMNSVVGLKPTPGLTSRSGIVPISPRLETVGPMGRTVADTAALLDAIAGFDPLDAEKTMAGKQFIPAGGFVKMLNAEGLKGKRLGILRRPFFNFSKGSVEATTFATHFETMTKKGAILVDIVEMKNLEIMIDQLESGEVTALLAEFKLSVNAYLKQLVSSSVRSLADVIEFNKKHSVEERMEEFGQAIFLASERTNGLGEAEKAAISRMEKLSKEGMEDTMKEQKLDAVVYDSCEADHAMAIGGFPIINVPAGYSSSGAPFGIAFAGLKGSDAKLIEIAYAFEQATNVRKLPPLL
ncbi:Glutamyl-tRNA(Gln) amidotransferase subunit A, chloroplastic/mitochondrial [Apostasia shenzhenica]|uniref:Glutamyl-tRNA(Gln) amidotransferase subunit A, chloroplastic/mitochondrial n=1 Tax=Apostasia shenzhenica TaxID=1088818 RepID=A0A2I0A688_9ASPA|nr:Glutamyl-tRNA(Gln) amidotransferase subunit A, chloroplastic/mitochondrial [Apostasia shenzhenica]